MAFTNLGELRTWVRNQLDTDSTVLPDARIDEAVSMAEDYLYQDLIGEGGIRPLEASGTISLTAGTASYALPTRFLGMRRIYLDVDPNAGLEYRPPQDLYTRRGANLQQQPDMYTIEGENIIFAPTPDSAYTARLIYWQSLARVSADADTNWFYTNARGLVGYRVLIELALYMKTPREQVITWSLLYDDLKDRVMAANRTDRIPVGKVARSRVGII